MNRLTSLIIITFLMLIPTMSMGHTVWPIIQNVSVQNDVVAGEYLDVSFEYVVSHTGHGAVDCPWEIRLDTEQNYNRNGVLLASGSYEHPGDSGEEIFSVVTDNLIPPETAPATYYIKIIVANDGWYAFDVKIVYSLTLITVEPADQTLEVEIDIKPCSYPNTINLGSNGVVPVAILSSETFDATEVDPDTVLLAGSSVAVRGRGNKFLASVEDINCDGLPDLVCKVETENLDPEQLQDGIAILTGTTYGGQDIEGQDDITLVPPE